jgi:hypothetical protein
MSLLETGIYHGDVGFAKVKGPTVNIWTITHFQKICRVEVMFEQLKHLLPSFLYG